MRSSTLSRLATLALALGLAACDGEGLTSAHPTPQPTPLLAALSCTAKVSTHAVQCSRATPETGASTLLLGGQGVYVQLTSSNITTASDTFAFDVTMQNLLPAPQAMATLDGATGTVDGVRIFFSVPPAATVGTGTVIVANPDGQGTFTSTNQDYFQYTGTELGADGILSANEATSPRRWKLAFDPGVQEFAFKVFVATDVRYPDGWIDLTPAADSLLEGTTQALSATVRSAVGLPVGDAVSWGTSDAAVATVDGSGTVSALAPGAATITATAGTRSATAALSVCPDLDVGEAYYGTMPAAASLCFAGGASGNAEYVYSPINFSSSAALSLTLTGTGIAAIVGPPSPARIPSSGLALHDHQAADAFHMRMLEQDRALGEGLAARSGTRIRPAARGTASGAARRTITPGTPSVGDLMNLNVAQGCSGTPDLRVGQVRSVGQHVIVVADTTNPAGGFTTAQYDSIALEFDSLAYPVDTANFGGPTDLDTNQRVVAFYTRAVNELSPPASSVVVLGYFTSRDLFSSDPVSGCSRSNEGEMFYMLVPDPTGAVNSNVRTVSYVRGSTVGTMAHELQHLINGARRIYINGAAEYEQVWLNEGLSHIAEELMFYRTSGMSPRVNIAAGTNATSGIQLNARRVAAYNTYQSQNFGRFRSWMQRPDTAGPIKGTDVLAVRGAIWSFLRYAADRRNAADADLWFALVNSTTSGTANLQNALATDPNPWVRDWIASMYVDDAVAGISSVHTNPSWNYRSMNAVLYGSYQLLTRPLTDATPLTLSYSRGGGTAYARFGVPTGTFAGVTALSGGLAPTSPYSLVVVRTK